MEVTAKASYPMKRAWFEVFALTLSLVELLRIFGRTLGVRSRVHNHIKRAGSHPRIHQNTKYRVPLNRGGHGVHAVDGLKER